MCKNFCCLFSASTVFIIPGVTIALKCVVKLELCVWWTHSISLPCEAIKIERGSACETFRTWKTKTRTACCLVFYFFWYGSSCYKCHKTYSGARWCIFRPCKLAHCTWIHALNAEKFGSVPPNVMGYLRQRVCESFTKAPCKMCLLLSLAPSHICVQWYATLLQVQQY